ncbi:MAG: heme peroxidase family protein [Acidobacteria bacterium]|nr:heme peroxidase family protein [Acidobacteriota bacterium]MCA1649949.1 heme peroxidase family protein [Acidobacteriota bacterium]
MAEDPKHGSESYFVLGEGLLTESVGGRARTLAAAAEAVTPPFRFSRMGPSGINRQLPDANRKKIANAMAAGGGGASQIPAGYTYLGQFVDHDLTFDKTNVMLDATVSPSALLQARSPSLDLDSLYGAGPADPGSARFYQPDGLHLKMGKTVAEEGITSKDGFDLPRGAGATAAAKRKAIIPDPRNDENLAVAQTHLAMIRFHNRVVDTLPASVPLAQRFEKAREVVTKHYQWMLRTDYLPRICTPGVISNVFANGRKAFEVGVPSTDVPTMPIEFSVAAFRLGHAMIRRAYNWNRIFDDGFGSLELLFEFTAHSGTLGGNQRLPSTWIADFRRLYDFREAGRSDLAVPAAKFNRAMRIDTTLVNPLRSLPGFPEGPEANLAFRNLARARMVHLATGQQMATFLRGKGVTVTTLTRAQLRDGNGAATLEALTQPQRDALFRNTPLWFYILREAELNGGRLKGVGARIVAETFHRAMEGSNASIVRDPTWRPSLGPNSTTFRMVDLLIFAFRGRKALLNPLGD